MYRSTPFAGNGGVEYLGLQLYDGNPYAKGNHFADFVNDAYKVAGGISFRKPHAGVSKTSLLYPAEMNCHIQVLPTVFLDTGFDFEDGVEGNYILGRPPGGFNSDRRGIVFDWDGTITGRPLATVIRWYDNSGLLS